MSDPRAAIRAALTDGSQRSTGDLLDRVLDAGCYLSESAVRRHLSSMAEGGELITGTDSYRTGPYHGGAYRWWQLPGASP